MPLENRTSPEIFDLWDHNLEAASASPHNRHEGLVHIGAMESLPAGTTYDMIVARYYSSYRTLIRRRPAWISRVGVPWLLFGRTTTLRPSGSCPTRTPGATSFTSSGPSELKSSLA